MNEQVNKLINTVIENDYCIGCGICASLEGSPFEMKLNEDGKYIPVIKDNPLDLDLKDKLTPLCPFSDDAKNETEIGKELYSDTSTGFDKYSGYYIKNYAGYVKESDYRKRGSSGGVGSWIAAQLLENNLVDGILHVKSNDKGIDPLFKYDVSFDVDELKQGAKSKYYPVEMSEVIDFVRNNDGIYALIGIPCFIKSIRLLSQKDSFINERIKYTIGLVCGHLKSDMFAKSIGWELGIEPENLTYIDFRKKLPDKSANNYGVEVTGLINGEEKKISSPTKDLYVTNWGQGHFKYNACEFCDDVLAETADITVGDAWLPQYQEDSMGTNVIIVRHPDIQKIIDSAGDKLHLDELDASEVYQSQAGGFRHRRDGLAYRLYLKDQQNIWRPEKRVQATNKINNRRKKIYVRRGNLSKESFHAFKLAQKEKDFDKFFEYMDPLIAEYNKVNRASFIRRVLSKIKRTIMNTVK